MPTLTLEDHATNAWNAGTYELNGQTFTLLHERKGKGVGGSSTTSARDAQGKVVATHKSQWAWTAKKELIRKLNKLVLTPAAAKVEVTAANLADARLRGGMSFDVVVEGGEKRRLHIHKAGEKSVSYSFRSGNYRRELGSFLATYIWDLPLEEKLAIYNQ